MKIILLSTYTIFWRTIRFIFSEIGKRRNYCIAVEITCVHNSRVGVMMTTYGRAMLIGAFSAIL